MSIHKQLTKVALFGLVMIATAMVGPATQDSEAGFRRYRQYYSSWSYRPARRYYYSTYYYKPYSSYSSYNYHYCVHYPSRPRYTYYYNPHSRRYWGRFDHEGKEGAQYSILAEKDRKENLDDIPESAFPAPAAMPTIPDSEDGVQIEPPASVPGGDLPGTDDEEAASDAP